MCCRYPRIIHARDLLLSSGGLDLNFILRLLAPIGGKSAIEGHTGACQAVHQEGIALSALAESNFYMLVTSF